MPTVSPDYVTTGVSAAGGWKHTLSAAHSVFTQWAVRLGDSPPSTPVSGQLHLGKHLTLSHTHAAVLCSCLREFLWAWGLDPTALVMKLLRHSDHCSVNSLQTGVLIGYHTLVTTMTTTRRKHGWKKYAARLMLQNCIKLNNPRMTVLEEMCGFAHLFPLQLNVILSWWTNVLQIRMRHKHAFYTK